MIREHILKAQLCRTVFYFLGVTMYAEYWFFAPPDLLPGLLHLAQCSEDWP